jgi:hypothetical protein
MCHVLKQKINFNYWKVLVVKHAIFNYFGCTHCRSCFEFVDWNKTNVKLTNILFIFIINHKSFFVDISICLLSFIKVCSVINISLL